MGSIFTSAKETYRAVDSESRRGRDRSQTALKAWRDGSDGSHTPGAKWSRAMAYAAWLRRNRQSARAQEALAWVRERSWRWGAELV